MLAPDANTAVYWACAGDVFSRCPETGARPMTPETAARLHGFHLTELTLAAARADRGAHDFHRLRERELRTAIRALGQWRRAAGLQSWSASRGAGAS